MKLHLLMMSYALRVVGRALFGDAVEDKVAVLDELVPEASFITRRRMFRPFQVPIGYPYPGNGKARRLRDAQYAVVDDILNRTETAMTQAHCFLTMQLVLEAQHKAQSPLLT